VFESITVGSNIEVNRHDRESDTLASMAIEYKTGSPISGERSKSVLGL
jgi:hypothetical protein